MESKGWPLMTEWTYGDSPAREQILWPPKTFRLIAPAALMLPDFDLPGYDPTETPGYRAAWLEYWAVADGPSHIKSIRPSDWRMDIGSGPAGTDVRFFPDEYLRASLTEISLRLGVYQDQAIRVLLMQPGNWRTWTRELIDKVQRVEGERFSKYNPPYRSALFRIPIEFRDRVRD